MHIEPVLYKNATAEQKAILEENFEVYPFGIVTIKLERIFVDKIFAAEFYYRKLNDPTLEDRKRKNAAFDAAKHVYDLMILFEIPKIKALLSDNKFLKQIIEFKREEELARAGGIEPSLKINNFSYLNKSLEDQEFLKAYEKMQEIYVFNDKDKLPLTKVGNVFRAIKAITE